MSLRSKSVTKVWLSDSVSDWLSDRVTYWAVRLSPGQLKTHITQWNTRLKQQNPWTTVKHHLCPVWQFLVGQYETAASCDTALNHPYAPIAPLPHVARPGWAIQVHIVCFAGVFYMLMFCTHLMSTNKVCQSWYANMGRFKRNNRLVWKSSWHAPSDWSLVKSESQHSCCQCNEEQE